MRSYSQLCRTAQRKAAHGTAMHVAASRRCDFARRGRVVEVSIGTILPAASQLNTLAPHAPEGWMQRLSPLHECGGAEMPPHSWTRFAAPTERTCNPAASQSASPSFSRFWHRYATKQGEQAR
jgi:hypothetical protein